MITEACCVRKHKASFSEMPDLIRVCAGYELTSYQAPGTLGCHEVKLNEKDGRSDGVEAEVLPGQRGSRAWDVRAWPQQEFTW